MFFKWEKINAHIFGFSSGDIVLPFIGEDWWRNGMGRKIKSSILNMLS